MAVVGLSLASVAGAVAVEPAAAADGLSELAAVPGCDGDASGLDSFGLGASVGWQPAVNSRPANVAVTMRELAYLPMRNIGQKEGRFIAKSLSLG
jgi:hypothetical protein